MLNKTEHRLALAILVTAILPLASAMMLAYSLLNYASSVWLRPEVGEELVRGIDVYKDYVKAVKDDMKHQTDAIASDELLRASVKKRDAEACARALDAIFPRFPELVALTVEDEHGPPHATRDRGREIDEATERKLEVRRPILEPEGDGPSLVATFAFNRRYEQSLERAGAIHDTYHAAREQAHEHLPRLLRGVRGILGITVIVTVPLGFFSRAGSPAHQPPRRAIDLVAAGNLDVRVPVTGTDELTELARVFNRMLGEMQQSRARIEYLQRIGAWQEMAQRLAHEIKNPLTPIQLAVQECHRKYAGEDPRFRALLDTTLEIVEEEVGTLRRLVGNFSSFARLPHAELREASLRDFLRECSEQLGHLGAELRRRAR
jgi:two-component system nitrogen regulation sensor histidine kinase NtrY